jgi:hypothetical protein
MQLLTGGLLASGEVGNILEGEKRSAFQNLLLKYANNPQLLTQMIARATLPLSQALTQSVTNSVQGNVASRGLAQAPGVFAGQETQALAPYVLQNQQNAQNAVLSALGAPAGTFQQPSNLTPALAMFMRSLSPGQQQGGGITLPGTPGTTSNPQPTFPIDIPSDPMGVGAS